jgi:diacylglycerol kinase family enzyme
MARLDARKNIDIAHHSASDQKILSVAQIVRLRLEQSPARRLKLHVDSQDLSGDYILLEAMNIRCIGPNLHLAPQADFGDGLFDLVLVAEDQREQMDRYLSCRADGKEGEAALPVVRGRHLRLECEELRVHIDDDIWPEDGEHPPYSPMVIDLGFHEEGCELLLPA